MEVAMLFHADRKKLDDDLPESGGSVAPPKAPPVLLDIAAAAVAGF
jgi:hypothetical protein